MSSGFIQQKDPESAVLTIFDLQQFVLQSRMLGCSKKEVWVGTLRLINGMVPDNKKQSYALLARGLFELDFIYNGGDCDVE